MSIRTCRHEIWTCIGLQSLTDHTPLQEGVAQAPSEADDRMEVSEEDHADSPQAAGPSLPADQGVAALGQEQPAGEDEGDDFRAGTGSDEEDDEATLEEEEVRPPHPPCPCASRGVVISLRRHMQAAWCRGCSTAV